MHGNVFGPQYDHFIYLSTPESAPVSYTVSAPDGSVLFAGTVSNGASVRHDLGTNYDSPLFVPVDSLGGVLRGKGVIIRAAAPIYASYRNVSLNGSGFATHATILSCKGQKAKGTTFRIGGSFNIANPFTTQRTSFFSVMATEDGTLVSATGLRPGVVLMGTVPLPATGMDVVLDAGQSVVYSAYVDASNPANSEPFLGALLEASKPVVLNNGFFKGFCCAWTGSGHDVGLDQSVPIELIGTEYVLIRGESATQDHERPIIIAHEDGTEVYVNGNATPLATLSAGAYILVPGSLYSALGNMYIRTSKPTYCYQHLLGAANPVSAELNFIPPISCNMPNTMGPIPSVHRIGDVVFNSGITVVTQVEAQLVLTDANGTTFLPAAVGNPVPGNPYWKTVKLYGLVGDVRITSTRPMAAGVFGGIDNAGFAGYFSGFNPSLSARFQMPALLCVNDPVPVEFTGSTLPDASVQWDFDGAQVLDGEDLGPYTLAFDVPGTYKVGLWMEVEGCRDSLLLPLLIDPCSPLPVSWLDLQAEARPGEVALRWLVAQELGLSHYVLERSADGRHFMPLAVQTPGSPALATREYHHWDPRPLEGLNYYRVVAHDEDGSTDPSQVVAVRWGGDPAGPRVHVDPTDLSIAVLGARDGDAPGALYNALGQRVALKPSGGAARFEGHGLAPGWYVLLWGGEALRFIMPGSPSR